MKIVSFGGGVQSTAMAVLAAQGKIEVDAFVFCDTGFEQSIVFDFLNAYTQPMLEKAGIPFYIAKAEQYSSKFADMELPPFFTAIDGIEGRSPAFCSSLWKKRVFERFCNENFKQKKYDVLMGFSTDEIHRATRMKPSKKWNCVFPLLDLKMRRGDCIALVEREFNVGPPRSSCWMCPNHTQHEWDEVMKSADAEKVISFDRDVLSPRNWFLTAEYKRITNCSFIPEHEVMFSRLCSGDCFL
jgi:3'-phosphoadenosine 5'-phosphosulfate sulfotransferase (PAPS reductase)/FAD synthetase